MNEFELYHLSLYHPQVRALVPRGFFPSLPQLRMVNGKCAIRLLYTVAKHMRQDCLAVTLSGQAPHRVIEAEVLKPEGLDCCSIFVPEHHPDAHGYYKRCTEILQMTDAAAQARAVEDLDPQWQSLRHRLSIHWLMAYGEICMGWLGHPAEGKTCYREEAMEEEADI